MCAQMESVKLRVYAYSVPKTTPLIIKVTSVPADGAQGRPALGGGRVPLRFRAFGVPVPLPDLRVVGQRQFDAFPYGQRLIQPSGRVSGQ